ncbi:MAG: RNA-binding transcriptional accessory protein, partial [Proteobacteria bacterium]
QGATDILIERLSENADLRLKVREKIFAEGGLNVGKAEKAKPNSKYEMYFTYEEKIENLLKKENSHRYLAIRRGWMEEELTLSIGGGSKHPELESDLIGTFENEACTKRDSMVAPVLLKAAKLALKAHVLPSIENEAHKAMKDLADGEAIQVFSENLKKLLLASPFGPKAVVGVDPGIRTGCKVAVVNDSGKFVADTVIYLQTEDQKSKAKELLKSIVETGGIRAIAVGNGTAGRETEAFIRAALKEANLTVPVVMVSESGASVYSASEVAREEFPELDLTVRGAISIARRLQDPLSELVKVDPKAIGVGQYQHDVSPNSLKKSLELVVDTCVNSVGVNLNTASYHLLKRVSGIGEALAKSIVEVRSQKGLFKSRKELQDVPRFSTKTFEQAAGFLRVPESENPLDNTGVHPERYSALEEIATRMGKSLKELASRDAVTEIRNSKDFSNELKEKLGELTYQDVLSELEKPGRDPRESFVAFSYRDDIFELKDVKPEMICPGIVTNVTNFGAFVDVGVHQDGFGFHDERSARRLFEAGIRQGKSGTRRAWRSSPSQYETGRSTAQT